MSLTACLEEQIGRLVHPTALASPELGARHRLFFETRLAVGCVALAVLPLSLVTGLVPGWLDVLVIGSLVLPFVAVATLSGRGRIGEAELISAMSWIGLAATSMASGLVGPGAAAGLLLLVPLEACVGGRLARPAWAAFLITGLLLFAAAGRGSPAGPADALVVLLGTSYAALICWRSEKNRRSHSLLAEARDLRSQTVLEAISDVVIRFDGVGATIVNPAAAKTLLRVDPDELAGRGFFDRLHLADRPAFLQLIGDASRADTACGAQLRLRTAPTGAGPSGDAGFVTIELRLQPLLADRAEDDASRSVTLAQMRLVPAAPPATVQIAENADDSWRDRFLANISHELRTPLNAVIGFSEMLASDAHAPQQAEKRREYAEIIHASGQHLLSIVNSMLDLSKIDAGKFALTPEPFDVAELLAACCDMVRLRAEQSRIDLVWKVEPERLQITADKRACRQILLNLLSNALKFTPEYGRAAVEARMDGDWMTLVVTDTGIGMLAQDMARLGDPFFQAQNSKDRRFEGTGLGLSVVSGLVGLHGGTITAESAPGEGTRMTIRLPREVHTAGEQFGKAKIVAISSPVRPAASSGSLLSKVKKIA